MTPGANDPFDAGPYAAAQARLHIDLSDKAGLWRRMFLAGVVALGPLLILAGAQGLLIGPTRAESLLYDIAALVRYAIALPILLVAEWSYLPRLATIVREFVDSGLIVEADRDRYAALIDSTRRLLASRVVAVVLVVVAYGMTIGLGPLLYPPTVSTWVTPITPSGHQLSAAGWYRTLVSQPLLLLVFNIFLWRLLLWTRFLWKVSRLNLRLLASHPDQRGGLGFIPASVRGFPPLAFALGSIVASSVCTWIVIYGYPTITIQYGIIFAAVGVALLLTVPLLVFGPVLFELRTRGVYAYGRLMQEVGRRFEARWLQAKGPDGVDPVGAPDFSSMIDLSTVVANVHAIKPWLFDLQSLMPLVIATVAPFLPLAFFVFPLKDVAHFFLSFVT